MAHEFTACEIFGTRYSALGKRIETSLPHGECDNARTITSEMDIFQLCDHLGLELEDEEAELDYLIENRKQYYNTHSYMEKHAIAEAHDGPVFRGDTLYRQSNGEKWTVQEDGSLKSAAGKVIKEPQYGGYIHFYPGKGVRGPLLPPGNGKRNKNPRLNNGPGKPVTDKSQSGTPAPAITLPGQANPLVSGPCTMRTPEEAAKAAAFAREQVRKAALKAAEEEKQIVKEHYQEKEEEAKREVANFLQRRFIHFCEDVAAGRGEAPEVCEFRKYASKEILAYIPHDMLLQELRGRGKDTPSGKLLQAYTDKDLAEEMEHRDGLFGRLIVHALKKTTDADLAEELRRRGYEVTATKRIEL